MMRAVGGFLSGFRPLERVLPRTVQRVPGFALPTEDAIMPQIAMRSKELCSIVSVFLQGFGARGNCVRCDAYAVKDSDMAADLSFPADSAGAVPKSR